MAPTTFRSRFNRVLSIVAWAVLGAAAVGALLTPGVTPVLLSVPLGASGAAALVWALLWSPHITIDDEGVDVANVLLVHHVPWAALIHVDTRYALTLHVPGRHIRATAAPAPGQLAAHRAARAERWRVRDLASDGLHPGELPSTDSGSAARLVRERWEHLRDAGRIEAGVADVTPVGVRPRVAEIAAITLGAAAITVAVLSV
ncbi:MAG: PH domain-containing protein [Microbacterium sp.]|uniref:PH domain-containing protein n=1 Tax=Microbacterium sp. TaxID=51671 RepID=UPI0039E71EB4